MLISTLFNGISLGMIIPLSDRVLTNKRIILPVKVPMFLEDLIERLNTLSPLVVLKGIFFFFQNYLMTGVGQRCVKELRKKIYEN